VVKAKNVSTHTPTQLHTKNVSFDLHLIDTNTITTSDKSRFQHHNFAKQQCTTWGVRSEHKELNKLVNTRFALDL